MTSGQNKALKKVAKMSEDRYDFVIFGATGFTGQFVVDEVARVIDDEGGNLSMAVAGRSMEKLQKVLQQSSQRTGKNVEETAIIIADTGSAESLAEMCKQAKVVLNCVGPYRFYGEQVVKACIENGAHHVDISGEPQYLEKMQLLYNGKAREEGVYVVGACGFDSVPSDMGIAYTTKQFDGDINSIEFYITLHPGSEGLTILIYTAELSGLLYLESRESVGPLDHGITGNVTTLESALYGIAHAGDLKPLRKQLFKEPLPRSKYKIQPKSVGFHDEVNKWCFNFPGSDRAIVNRSVRYNYEVNQQRPFQVGAYIMMPKFLYIIGFMIFGLIIGIMAKFSFGRALILKYPNIFTFGMFKKGGPSKKQMEESGFSIQFLAKGWKDKLTDPDAQHDSPPDQKLVTKVSGPEAGYVTTPICMVQCAVVLLKEISSDKFSGGVYTTASMFRDTTLIDRLNKHNVKFEIVEQQKSI